MQCTTKRGVGHAEEVILLGDGAPWIWLRLGLLFSQAIQILDWNHAEDYVVQVAITYYTNNQHRMNYPAYRQRGLQIGSGTIESGCKRVAKARLDQPGMTWTVEGAQTVLKARAAYLSGQWDDFWQNRPFRPRAYGRQSEQETRLAA